MESSRNRAGEIGEDVLIILVTVAQLIFFTRFHRYISWPATEADGTVTWLSMLADGYFTWLSFVVTAFLILQATFYGVAAVVLFVRLKRSYSQGGS